MLHLVREEAVERKAQLAPESPDKRCIDQPWRMASSNEIEEIGLVKVEGVMYYDGFDGFKPSMDLKSFKSESSLECIEAEKEQSGWKKLLL